MSLIGCTGSEEDDDGQILTLATNKFKFRSSIYRMSKGKMEMAGGKVRAAPVAKTRLPRPDVSGLLHPPRSGKAVIANDTITK